MGVYIKDMEMPKNCIDCAFGWNGWCHRINSGAFVEVDMRRHDCPLIEVPVQPHGDLIGRKWLIDIAFHLMHTSKNDDIANGVKWLLQYIIEAPTIIEAEPSEEQRKYEAQVEAAQYCEMYEPSYDPETGAL